MDKSLEKVINLSGVSPVLTNKNNFQEVNCIIIDANISSKDLGIVNTEKGLKAPVWFVELRNLKAPILVIKDIDKIQKEEQEKFYEILKYRTISSVDMPKDCKIIVTYKKIDNVSSTITSLCLID